MSQVLLTKRTETSRDKTNMEELTNNGTSFTLTNGKVNQEKENSMKTSVSMLRETSTLYLNCQTIDISIYSTTDRW